MHRYDAAMRLALTEAARCTSSGDVPVGCVVLGPDGEVVGAGHNAREATNDPTAHAEVVALRAAAKSLNSWRLTGCTLLVTLEPCTMCAGALVLARVDRLVFGAWNADTGAVGSLFDVVRDRRINHRPEVVAGVLEADCTRLLSGWFDEQRRFGTPPGVG